ncbi:MAG: NAD(P)/FAD-dependent oxidoreductase [Candidatus Hydrogenedentota bacterium]|nr:MAG: NAD(P)/FAD-dependent oxidoreductase [Candidatus Hydrogenedentota bacterium]
MKKLVILGAGTAGTMIANHLHKRLKHKDWEVTLLDPNPDHYYQPGFLFVPFGIYSIEDTKKPKQKFIPSGMQLVQKGVEAIEPDKNQLILEGGEKLSYDILIVATGSRIVPEETEGMKDRLWRKKIFDFYTPEGAVELYKALQNFEGGDLVIHLTEMPIKCPVAPLEFSFLADWYLTKKGLRNKTRITYVTPLSGAFTKPVTTKVLGEVFARKNIALEADFMVEHIDNEKQKLVSYDEREVPFDLLVTIPTNMGAKVIETSGFGDDLYFIPTDHGTLQSKVAENMFVIGDATNVPASKAGSVAHFEAEILIENILAYIDGKEFPEKFDGHANCFIESGFKKGFLIDFNYDHEPVPGKFPFAGIGPLSLLKESRLNHLGKMAFRWIYWNMLLKARKIPGVTARMKLSGKKFPK